MTKPNLHIRYSELSKDALIVVVTALQARMDLLDEAVNAAKSLVDNIGSDELVAEAVDEFDRVYDKLLEGQ